MLRQYVEQCVDAVVCRRVDELFRDGHRGTAGGGAA